MKKIIVIILIGIKLIALDFGKDVDIVGKWYIRSVDDLMFSFASGVGNKWVFNFKQDGSIYDISKEKEAKKQLNWKYDKEGIVHINFEFQTENKELSNLIFSNLVNDYIKIKEKINLKENRNCYLVNVINRERDIYMCEILDKKEIQRRERERAKKAIKIN
ncbi:hypothetical protein [Campylobacter showae]|uniref:hypothetical protein n=1 Tax=Campylobacter showae TaxID=204 RepID=UPI000F07CCE1|nr:hypothetical protein [Campylobacter showae]